MRVLLRSWGDSLKLLLPSNLKQWALITLKGTVETYKILFKRFWWLLALIVGSGGIFCYRYFSIPFFVSSPIAQLFPYFLVFFIALWLYTCILVARPSVRLKDTSYFVSYYKRIGSFTGSALLFALLFLAITLLIVGGVYLANAFKLLRPVATAGSLWMWIIMVSLVFTFLLIPTSFGLAGLYVLTLNLQSLALAGTTILLHVMFSPIYLFTVLFLLDARPSTANVFKSVWNGIKLAWYTYPITLLLLILFQVLGWGLMMIGSFTISFLVGALLLPLYINIFMYLYIKQIHEQPDRYLR